MLSKSLRDRLWQRKDSVLFEENEVMFMSKVLLGIVGLFAIVVAISVAPDVRRYIRISSM